MGIDRIACGSFGPKLCTQALGAALGIVLAVNLLMGCSSTPPPERPLFEDAKQAITPGYTTRADVLRQLGEPTIARRDERLLVYAAFQVDSVFIPVGEHVRRTSIGKWYLLSIQLDERDVVSSVDAPWQMGLPNAMLRELCNSSGECFLVGRAGLAVFATDAEDSEAKEFTPATDRCTLYTYPDADHDFFVSLNGTPMGASSGRGYFQWQVAPGKHVVTTYAAGDEERAKRLAVDCGAGQVLFVEYRDPGVFADPQLALVDKDRGEDGARRGRLILDDL